MAEPLPQPTPLATYSGGYGVQTGLASMHAADRERLISGTLLLAAASVWMLRHGYLGIWHDAKLYILQALTHLKPELLGNDIFVRFGSQDRFTLFSPLFAAVIRAIGIEPAAAALTLAFHATFIAATWCLARRLLPTHQACLALGLLLAVPSDYGGLRVFGYLEDFLTPRLAAETFVLAGVAALVARRHFLTWSCMVIALALHPLMAAGGVLLALCVQFAFPYPWRTGVLCAIGIAGVLLALLLTPAGIHLRFDAQWLELVRRAPYLFVSCWTLSDWSRALVPLTTLLIGWLTLEVSQARALCIAALIVGVVCVAGSFIGADVLHIVFVTQVQPWRALWLGNVLAIILLPLVISRTWNTGVLGIPSASLLVVLWLLGGEVYALELAPVTLAVAFAATKYRDVSAEYRRIAITGSLLMVLPALIWITANVQLFMSSPLPDDDYTPAPLRYAREWARDGSLPALAMFGLFWLCHVNFARYVRHVAFATMAALCMILVPASAAQWTRHSFTPGTYRAFAPWRQLIPPREEVFWADGPEPAWILLERPSYVSDLQAAGALFSRRAAIELDRREHELAALQASGAPGRSHVGKDQTLTLASVCSTSEVKFIITRTDLKAQPLDEVPQGLPAKYRQLRLYRCDH